jgi:hypothetical protein
MRFYKLIRVRYDEGSPSPCHPRNVFKDRLASLTDAQLDELRRARDCHRKPYVRERAAAILKVHAGQSANHVAADGLLRPHRPETVSAWIYRYLDAGLPGLSVKAGRGRKPAFSPS